MQTEISYIWCLIFYTYVTLLLKFFVDKSVGSKSLSFCARSKCCDSPRLKWSTTLITIIVIGSSGVLECEGGREDQLAVLQLLVTSCVAQQLPRKTATLMAGTKLRARCEPRAGECWSAGRNINIKHGVSLGDKLAGKLAENLAQRTLINQKCDLKP